MAKDIYQYSQENAKLYGGEIGLHLHPHPLDWLHINSSYEMVIGKQQNGDYLPLIPAHKLLNTLKTEFSTIRTVKNSYVYCTLETNFKQSNISVFESPTSAYNLVSLGLGGDLNVFKLKSTVNFSVNNLFNTSYISHLSRLKNDGIENMGRNFLISLKLEI